MLKRLLPKNVASIQIQKDATFNSDCKQINLIPINHSDITNNRRRLFFDAFVYSWNIKKNQKYYEILTIYECVKKYWLLFVLSEWLLNVATLRICMDATFFLIVATDKSKRLVTIKSDYVSP